MSNKVLKGKNGWLFLHNDTNGVLDQITGKKYLEKNELFHWEKELTDRQNHAKKNNYKYIFLIIPNKHCVYSEYLPDEFALSEKRPALQIANINSSVMYPVNELVEHKNICELYHKTDTHWNPVGASIVFNKISKNLLLDGQIPIDITTSVLTGDLGSKMTPPLRSTSYVIDLDKKGNEVFFNNVKNVGGYIVFSGVNKSYPTVIVFGDSFMRSKLSFLGQIFSKIYFFHAPVYDKNLIEKIKPDVVISANVERFVNKFKRELGGFLEILYAKIESLANISIGDVCAINLDNFEKIFDVNGLKSIDFLREQWIKLSNLNFSMLQNEINAMDENECIDFLDMAISRNVEIARLYLVVFERLLLLKSQNKAMLAMNRAIEIDKKYLNKLSETTYHCIAKIKK